MRRRITQIVLLVAVVSCSVALAQTPQRLWYRGPFDGWVDNSTGPASGYYYHPSPDPTYPLHEAAYGQPVPCEKCGHMHYPGQAICPYCGQQCSGGGNDLDPSTVYTPQRLPGQYWFKEQPHYGFVSPLPSGMVLKYRSRWD